MPPQSHGPQSSLDLIARNRSTEPRKLSLLVRGDLDWIVMKSLEKERSRRYETANGLVRDIERFLNDEAVEACPPSLSYRLKKYVKKNRGKVIAATTVFATLIAGLIGTSWGLHQARRAEAKTVAVLVQVTQERNAKELERQNADAARLRSEAAEKQILESYRASTDDTIQELIGSKEDIGPKEKAYLEKTLARWQAFANQQGDDVRSREIRAEGCHRVGYLYHMLGQNDLARIEYELAHQLLKNLTDEFPNDSSKQFNFAECRVNLSVVLDELGDSVAATAECEAAKTSTWHLTRLFSDDDEFKVLHSHSYAVLGNIRLNAGDGGGALAYSYGALLHAEDLVKQHPGNVNFKDNLASCHNGLGAFYLQTGDPDTALREFDSAAEIWFQLCSQCPATWKYRLSLGGVYCNKGSGSRALSDLDGSLEWYRQAIELLSPIFSSQPGDKNVRTFLCNSHAGRAAALVGLQRDADSLTDWDQAIALSQRRVLPAYRVARAEARIRTGQWTTAVAELDDLVELTETDEEMASNWSAYGLYQFAYLYSLASGQPGSRIPNTVTGQRPNRSREFHLSKSDWPGRWPSIAICLLAMFPGPTLIALAQAIGTDGPLARSRNRVFLNLPEVDGERQGNDENSPSAIPGADEHEHRGLTPNRSPESSPPPRRFHTVHDAAVWIQQNWPDFDLEATHPVTWRGER